MSSFMLLAFLLFFFSQFTSCQGNNQMNCVQKKCSAERLACQKEPKCNFALVECFQECGFNEQCQSQCLLRSQVSQVGPLWRCVEQNQCLAELKNQRIQTFQECMQKHCEGQLRRCSQDKDCESQIQDCQDKCGNDYECVETCVKEVKNPAVNILWQCRDLNSCEKPGLKRPGNCLEDQCYVQMENCKDLRVCKNALGECSKCAGNLQCWSTCLDQKQVPSAIDFFQCGINKGCRAQMQFSQDKNVVPAFTSCMLQKCQSEHQQCIQNQQCSQILNNCMNSDVPLQYDEECLAEGGQQMELVKKWTTCSIDNNCL